VGASFLPVRLNLERSIIELDSAFEPLEFDKADVQMGIVTIQLYYKYCRQ
jgi:hypothetical protein